MTEVNQLIPIKHDRRVFTDAGVGWLVRPIPLFERVANQNDEVWQHKINAKYMIVRDELRRRNGYWETRTGYGDVVVELSEYDSIMLKVSHGTIPGKRARYIFDNMASSEQAVPDIHCQIVCSDRDKVLWQKRNESGEVGACQVDWQSPQLAIVHRAINMLDTLLNPSGEPGVKSVGEVALNGA